TAAFWTKRKARFQRAFGGWGLDKRASISAEQVLAERRELAITAAKLSPPDYITKELGERPRDPEGRRAWDRGVAGIEGYRQEHGIKDRDTALGKEPTDSFERASWTAQRSRLAEQQRTLQLQQSPSASLELDNDMSIGM
ncbi:MAG TPA: hypothetical protein VKA53_06455, partial [Thermoanaerobaculia bacterium]|nr:hypothetical protein [Thermoanaerobaculia bacterium]